MTYARRFLRSCRPLLYHLNRLGLYLSNYQRSPFPESPQHSSTGCVIQNPNFFSGYTFPHEIIKQHQMTISISLRIQGQLWWKLLRNVSILCRMNEHRLQIYVKKQHVKIDKSRSLTSPRSPRNSRVRSCLLLSTLTLRKASFDCLTYVHMRHPILTKSRHVVFDTISSTLDSRTST